jgi:hypothetical protein
MSPCRRLCATGHVSPGEEDGICAPLGVCRSDREEEVFVCQWCVSPAWFIVTTRSVCSHLRDLCDIPPLSNDN